MLIDELGTRFAAARLLVVGDVMLDEYYFGEVRRISPEAPVPVLTIGSHERVGGGAANVAINAAAMGASVTLIGVTGNDKEASELEALVANCPRPVRARLIRDSKRRTTTKVRYVAGTQQLLRVDQEDAKAIATEIQGQVVEAVKSSLDDCDIVVISDYGKGVLSDAVLKAVFAAAKSLGKPAIVDPKRRDFNAYKGATLIKPNLAELRLATGSPCENQHEVDAAARRICDEIGADVLLTRAERGMSYYGYSLNASLNEPLHRGSYAREVFDVSGAGDTAIAVFAVARAAGYGHADAMDFANTAAGIAVSRLGTTVVSQQELASAMIKDSILEPLEHVVSLERALQACRIWRRQGLKVGFTNGCFDILHAGHVSLLAKSAAACDRLIVGMNSDNSVRRLKGPTRPAQNELSRAQVLASLESVDLVVPFDQDTPLELITALKPDVLIKGADYTEDQVVGGDVVKAAGGRIMLVEIVAGHSTTNTLRRIMAQA